MYVDPAQVNSDYPKLLSQKLIGPPKLEMASRDLLADHPISCYQTRHEVHWNQTCPCRIFFVISEKWCHWFNWNHQFGYNTSSDCLAYFLSWSLEHVPKQNLRFHTDISLWIGCRAVRNKTFGLFSLSFFSHWSLFTILFPWIIKNL